MKSHVSRNWGVLSILSIFGLVLLSSNEALANRELEDCKIESVEINHQQETIVTVTDCKGMGANTSYSFLLRLTSGTPLSDIAFKDTVERAFFYSKRVDVVGQKKSKKARLLSIRVK